MIPLRHTLTVLLGAAALFMVAAPVTPERARSEASELLAGHSSGLRKAAPAAAELTLNYTASSRSGDCFYIFNLPQGGFAIISADDRLPALLGFSENGSFDIDRIPENMKWWLDSYKKEITAFLEADPVVDPAVARIWRRASSEERSPVAPMLKTTWDQTEPYNNLCPVDSRTGRLSVTGCVATAMAQVMKYHEWPVNPTGSHGGVTFEGTTLEWSQMLDSYVNGNYSAAQATAVATLMRQCGASVDMMYSSYSSGAYSFNVPAALYTYFGYNKSMEMKWRDFYTQRAWNSMVYEELAAGRPIYYSGQSNEGGHAFVCDGYLSNDMFHFNWGWSGYQDGYFRLNALNPMAGGTGSFSGGYNSDQSIIIGVKKSEGETRLQQDIVTTGDFVYDSSKGVFKISGGANGQNLFYNPLGYDISFYTGLKVTDASDPGKIQYVKASNKTSLAPYYGFTELNFTIPSLSDGVYHLSPAFYNTYDEWQDILVPYGLQSYVTLTVKGGKKEFSNEGPDPATFSDIIPSEPDFVGPVYAYEGLAFRMNLNNVKPGDFYGLVTMMIVAEDDFGDMVSMAVHASVPGNGSAQVDFENSDGIGAGKYTVYILDSQFNAILEPFDLEVLERKNSPALPDGKGIIVTSVTPNFHRVGDPCGVTMKVQNDSETQKSTDFVVKILDAETLSTVHSLSSSESYPFDGGTSVAVNFNPVDLGLGAGEYYWRVENGSGAPLSSLQPLMLFGKKFEQNGLIYEAIDEKTATARFCGVSDEDREIADISDKVKGYKVVAITADALAFASSLKHVTLPEGVTFIPSGAFYNSTSLRYLDMRSQTPPSLGQRVFNEEKIPEIVVSGPLGYTNYYAASSIWAPFSYSSWNLEFADGIVPQDLLKDAQGNVFAPYYWEADEWMKISCQVPDGYFIHTEWTIGGETTVRNYLGAVELPPLYGQNGKARMSLLDFESSVEGIADGSVHTDVFDMQGRCLIRNADSSRIATLPKGIYIIGGKRIFIR